MADPRRRVKCPVSECEYTGRIDNAKAHLRSLIVWSIKHEGEAAEQDETSYTMASKESKNILHGLEDMGLQKLNGLSFKVIVKCNSKESAHSLEILVQIIITNVVIRQPLY